MRIMLVDNDGNAGLHVSLDEVKAGQYRLLWIDLESPTPEELASVQGYFGLHEVALDLDSGKSSMPKLQEFDDYVFIIWDYLRDKPDKERLETVGLHMILGSDYLVTAYAEKLEEVDEIFKRVISDPAAYRGQAAHVLYSILESAVDDYMPVVDELTDGIDTYMELLLNEKNVGDIKTILDLKHRNMALRRITAAHRDVIIKLSRRDLTLIPDELDAYLIDVYDHLAKISGEVDNNSDLISSSLDIHLNAVSNRMNRTMKRLAAIATVFMPLTFLVGLYGMNFEHMPEVTWQYGYLIFWLVLVAIIIVMFFIGKKQEWF